MSCSNHSQCSCSCSCTPVLKPKAGSSVAMFHLSDIPTDIGSIPYVAKLSKLRYPVEKLATNSAFESTASAPSVSDPATFDEVVAMQAYIAMLKPKTEAMNKAIEKFVNDGFKYIFLPVQSNTARPLILGYIDTGISNFPGSDNGIVQLLSGKYKGKLLDARFPKTQFICGNIFTPANRLIKNTIKVADVTTDNDESLITGNYLLMGLEAGNPKKNKIVYLVEEGDAAGEGLYDANVAVTGSIYDTTKIGIKFVGSNFVLADVNAAVATLTTLIAGNQKVIVAVSPNGTHTEETSRDFLPIWNLMAANGNLFTGFTVNYAPSTAFPIPIDFNYGVKTSTLQSSDMALLGFSLNPATYAQQLADANDLNVTYLDGLYWASNLFTPENDSVNLNLELPSGALFFINQTTNELVNYWLQPSIIAANTGIAADLDKNFIVNGLTYGTSAVSL